MNEKVTEQYTNDNKSQPIISEENFLLLRESQQRLSLATGFSPQVSKLVNVIITKERIEEAEQLFKKKFSDLGNL